MTPAATIARIFAGSKSQVSKSEYPLELPYFIRSWHVHIEDQGHYVVCLIEGEFKYFPADRLWESLVAVPIETVLEGYNIHAGMIVVKRSTVNC